VYREKSITPETAALLAAQDGVISRRQALGTGASQAVIDRLVRDDRWSRLCRGIYVRGVAEPTFRQHAWAGLLLVGEPAAVGGHASLFLRGLGREPHQIELVTPRDAQHRLPDRYVTLRDSLQRLDRRRGTLSSVCAEDALLDIGRTVSLEFFVGLVTDAVRERITTAARLHRSLLLRPPAARRAELLEVLCDLQGLESNLEYVFRRDVERAHGLPVGLRQVRTRAGRIDVLYKQYGVIAEVDGRLGHLTGAFRDLHRDNEHATSLLITLRYGSHDIRSDPCRVAAQLGRALEVRGWTGGPARCPACAGCFDR